MLSAGQTASVGTELQSLWHRKLYDGEKRKWNDVDKMSSLIGHYPLPQVPFS